MKRIAHRGGTDQYPELTIVTARHSLELGADYIELDIRFTKDNVPVISHDKDALRLFGDPVKIDDMTAAQFVSLRYLSDDSYHPHTLEEVLASGVAPILFHFQANCGPIIQVLQLIRAHGYEDKVVMGVMTFEDVHAVKNFNTHIKVLAFMSSKEQAMACMNSDADIIRLWEDWVDEESVRHIKAAGKQVWVMAGSTTKGTFGYASPENMLAWNQMGVDGVLVDKIEETQTLLRK